MKRNLYSAIVCSFLSVSMGVHAQSFTSSNLPIIILNTHGQYIDTAYQKFFVDMCVIDNGPGVTNYVTDPCTYYGEIETELHGSSSLWFPKKSYNVETVNSLHQKINISMLGMPPESDWVFNAPYQDKSLLRDQLAFRISNQMGNYSSRSRFFELVVSGEYRGVYELQEKIKRDPYRVDIAKLKPTDLAGDDLTGGYIIKLDKSLPGEEGWYSSYFSNITNDSANFFLYHYPKADSMALVQKNYIKDYFDHFEDVLVSPYYNDPDSGYARYLDVPSFVDNLIINEISKNVDGYRLSSYFYKDKDSKGGKLHCGPLWDLDIAWSNCSYSEGYISTGWQYQQHGGGWFTPFWWGKLMSDNAFKNQLKCRYEQLRGNVLSFAALYSYIDSSAAFLNDAQTRNFTKWPIMGTTVWPNPTPVPVDYTGEIAYLKNWLQQRLTWLDANMPGTCTIGVEGAEQDPFLLSVYPNPFSDAFDIVFELKEEADVSVSLMTVLGSKVLNISNGKNASGLYQKQVNTDGLSAGIYLVKVDVGQQSFYKKIVKN